MVTLDPSADIDDVIDYVNNHYFKKLNTASNKGYGSFVHIRWPVYHLHRKALDLSDKLVNGGARLFLIFCVIEKISNCGMMEPEGFCERRPNIFETFKNALDYCSSTLHSGLYEWCADWLQGEVFDPLLSGECEYVTGSGMENFAGEDLGDWNGIIKTFLEQVARPVGEGDKIVARVKGKEAEVDAAKQTVAKAKRKRSYIKRKMQQELKKAEEAVKEAEEELASAKESLRLAKSQSQSQSVSTHFVVTPPTVLSQPNAKRRKISLDTDE